MTVALEREDVRTVTTEIWCSFLATYGSLEWATEPLDDSELFQASVEIRGGWTGTVTLEMTPVTAETATRTMLSLASVDQADVEDALGELVNMIGGNIKSLLPSGSALGLPMVTHGVPRPAVTVDVTEHCRVELAWAGDSIRIRVWSDAAEQKRGGTGK